MHRPVGWKDESLRHGLAARGIRTSGRRINQNPGSRDRNERVEIYGMDVSRWRCPECYRGLRDGRCILHGDIIRNRPPVDILKSKHAREVAIDIRIWKVLKNDPDITIPELSRKLGMSKPILMDFMNRISDEVDGTTHLDDYRRAHPLKSYGIR